MTTSARKAFSTNKQVEVDGVEMLCANVRLVVARAGGSNSEYTKHASEIATKKGKQLQAGLIEDVEARRLLAQLYANYVIRSWETDDGKGKKDEPHFVSGVESASGEIVPDSVDARIDFLMDCPDFLLHIKEVAEDFGNFRASQIEETAKN